MYNLFLIVNILSFYIQYASYTFERKDIAKIMDGGYVTTSRSFESIGDLIFERLNFERCC